MKRTILILFIIPNFLLAQMKEDESGVAPGVSFVLAEEGELGMNLRFHYFPSHKMCIGLETNLFPDHEGGIGDQEMTLNGHYIFELDEMFGFYPLVGLGWKSHGGASGFRALMGGGMHKNIGRFAPYAEYIYGAGYESDGIFILGTFFTIQLKKE